MLSQDEAILVGLEKYRELFPEGTIPADLEDQGVFGATPGREAVEVYVTFWVRGQKKHPFFLFRASVDRSSGEVSVRDAADWRSLISMDLDDSKSV